MTVFEEFVSSVLVGLLALLVCLILLGGCAEGTPDPEVPVEERPPISDVVVVGGGQVEVGANINLGRLRIPFVVTISTTASTEEAPSGTVLIALGGFELFCLLEGDGADPVCKPRPRLNTTLRGHDNSESP